MKNRHWKRGRRERLSVKYFIKPEKGHKKISQVSSNILVGTGTNGLGSLWFPIIGDVCSRKALVRKNRRKHQFVLVVFTTTLWMAQLSLSDPIS